MVFVKSNSLNLKNNWQIFFTKPLVKDKFNYLRTELGILDHLNIA